MKVNEIFESIQGEGKYVGTPALFIRLSGCTRNCDFCDTKYHNEGKEMTVEEVADKIKESKLDVVVWTGGEPMLQEFQISQVIEQSMDMENIEQSQLHEHHVETNGDILPTVIFNYTSYIAFSPKTKIAQNNVIALCNTGVIDEFDIKIVTDLELNKDMINQATMLMPLTTFNPKEDLEIEQKVWKYCVKNNIKYTPRIHKDVWDNKRGV